MHIKHSLQKQLLGAVVGGTLALSLYYAYEWGSPAVEAILALPPAERTYELGASNIADKTTDEGNRKRLLSRNVRVAQQLTGAASDNNAMLNTVDDHSLDIAWPGNNPEDPKYTEVTGITPEVPEPEAPVVPTTDEDTTDTMNEWEALQQHITMEEDTAMHVEESNADDLADTGLGLGVIAAGALGGALGGRLKKAKQKN